MGWDVEHGELGDLLTDECPVIDRQRVAQKVLDVKVQKALFVAGAEHNLLLLFLKSTLHMRKLRQLIAMDRLVSRSFAHQAVEKESDEGPGCRADGSVQTIVVLVMGIDLVLVYNEALCLHSEICAVAGTAPGGSVGLVGTELNGKRIANGGHIMAGEQRLCDWQAL